MVGGRDVDGPRADALPQRRPLHRQRRAAVQNLDEGARIARRQVLHHDDSCREVQGHAVFCEQCKNPVFDPAVYRRDPELRQQALRRYVILTERMYRVCGPDGERQACQPYITRCGFRWNDEDAEDVY